MARRRPATTLVARAGPAGRGPGLPLSAAAAAAAGSLSRMNSNLFTNLFTRLCHRVVNGLNGFQLKLWTQPPRGAKQALPAPPRAPAEAGILRSGGAG